MGKIYYLAIEEMKIEIVLGFPSHLESDGSHEEGSN